MIKYFSIKCDERIIHLTDTSQRAAVAEKRYVKSDEVSFPSRVSETTVRNYGMPRYHGKRLVGAAQSDCMYMQ